MEAAAFTGALTRGLPSTGQTRLLRLAGDDRLVRAVRGGSDAAFEVLYERHHRSLLAFCRHMLGSREEAEDAVQTTFLAAYHELRTDDDRPIQLRPWLYAIARHRCLRVLRARRPRADVDLEQEPVATDGLGEQVQRRDDLRELLGDLGRLPEDQRAALLLAELHAMSHRDIGAVLDVPTQKVKALVFQARSSLIASRKARAIPCSEVRAQLGELSGGSLRRRELQRHLRECPGCSEFRAQLRRQKALLAAALPVVPSAGLRTAVLGTTTGGAGGAGGGGLLAGAAALKGVAAKLALGAGATAALAGGVVAGSGGVSGLDVGHGGRAVIAAPHAAPGAARLAAAPVARPRSAPTPTAATATASRPHARVRTTPAHHRRPHHHHHAAKRTPAAPATSQTGSAADPQATEHGRAAPKTSGPARGGEGNGARSHGGKGTSGAKQHGGGRGHSGTQSSRGAKGGEAKGNGGAKRHGGGNGSSGAQSSGGGKGSGAKGGGATGGNKPSHPSHPHASAPAQPAAPAPAQSSVSQAGQSEQHGTSPGQAKKAGSGDGAAG